MLNSTKHALISTLVLLTTGAVLADVQVLNVKDSQIKGNSPRLTDATGFAGPGTSDRLCVVNTAPDKGVRLTFISISGTGNDGISWKMLNTQTGATILYRQSASFANGSGVRQISGAAGGQFIDIPASLVARTTATCPPDGNVAKWIVLASPIPAEGGEWSSGVTLQATSL